MRTPRSIWITLSLLAVAGMLAAFSPLPLAPTVLTDAEAEGLAFMREEEKLAHDLYAAMADLYGPPVFANLAHSESMHMDAMLTLLSVYDLPDPAAGKRAGEFTDATLQALYDELLARARTSSEEALRVAAQVEETDILDLQARLAQNDQAEIAQVYRQLLQASGMHLRSFALQIERQTGSEYEPELLDASAFASLVDGAQAGGNGAGMRGRRGGRPW